MLNNQLNYERDWAFSSETLFYISCIQLYSAFYLFMFNDSGQFPKLDQTTVDETLFVRVDPETGSVAGGEDIRGPAMQLVFTANGYSSSKLISFPAYAMPSNYLMPMIRISEMYYILAENKHIAGDDTSALALLDEVRSHRGISSTLPPETDFMTELTREYYREFICEGQIFYFAKRVGVGQLSSTFSLSEANLVYPFPQTELDYGRIQK